MTPIDGEKHLKSLESYFLTSQEKLSRRDFVLTALRNALLLTTGSALLGAAAYTATTYVRSAAYAAKNVLDDQNETRTSQFNSDLKEFLTRLVTERALPHIKERMDATDAYRLETTSEMAIYNRYDVANAEGLQAGYYARLVELTARILNHADVHRYYVDFMMSREFNPGQGQRIFRIIDPLEEFVSTSDKDALEMRTQRQGLLNMCKKHVYDEFLSAIDGAPYFVANPDERKRTDRVIRPQSYYVVKHMRSYAPDAYDSHMRILEQHLINDGLTIERVSLIDHKKIVETSRKHPPGVKEDSSYALDQILMIDLFSDWYLTTGNGGTTLNLLMDNYAKALRVENGAENESEPITHSPEYLFTSPEATTYNNLPYAFYAAVINEKPALATPMERKRAVAGLINLMALEYSPFRKDGVMPCCRIETTQSFAHMVMSDYFAIRSIYSYLQNEEQRIIKNNMKK